VKVPAAIDDFERSDGRSQLDTLRVDTPDGGIDRTVEISQPVLRRRAAAMRWRSPRAWR
jgi:hypothetical protein